jgi:methanethiol S-methyltransferase
MLRRIGVLAYGGLTYAFFLVTFVYAFGFIAGVGVPKGIDDGPVLPAWQAILVDGLLLGVFAVQHSVMARPWFKERWIRVVGPAVERSTYVLAATAALALLLWQWRPLPADVWSSEGLPAALICVVYGLGWGVLVLSTFQIGHFELFGLSQVLARAQGRRPAEPGFRQPWLYRLIRHPIMTGFLITFWAAPQMSVGRLLFAAASTGYIVVGVRLEEHDLAGQLGEPYRRYLRAVPAYVPRLRRRAARPVAPAVPDQG